MRQKIDLIGILVPGIGATELGLLGFVIGNTVDVRLGIGLGIFGGVGTLVSGLMLWRRDIQESDPIRPIRHELDQLSRDRRGDY